MKKLLIMATVLFSSITFLFAQSADGVKGTWVNETKDAKVEIYKAGDKWAGKITWLKDMYEADGKTPRKDVKNNDANLRSRTIINLNILTGFSYDDGEWTGGELYDPKSGKTYKSKMKISSGKLEIRGYVGSPMFGKTTVWTKAS
jgi:uncharacterized protein (DUF2147 family)